MKIIIIDLQVTNLENIEEVLNVVDGLQGEEIKALIVNPKEVTEENVIIEAYLGSLVQVLEVVEVIHGVSPTEATVGNVVVLNVVEVLHGTSI